MLQLSAALKDLPVMSLRTGGMVAKAISPIINPNNLKIEGWYCQDNFSKNTLILLSKDVRDLVPQGLAIDDHGVLAEASELIRLREVLNLKFEVLGKPVYTDMKRKVGKVSDYATEMESLIIKKLYVAQPIYKNLSGGQLSVDRTQIVEITDKQITVRDVDVKAGSPSPAMLRA